MIRVAAEALALFFTPFVIFAVYLLVRRRNPASVDAWTASTAATLSLAGLACAAAAILLFGLLEQRPQGAYRPAHMENGRLIPGQFD